MKIIFSITLLVHILATLVILLQESNSMHIKDLKSAKLVSKTAKKIVLKVTSNDKTVPIKSNQSRREITIKTQKRSVKAGNKTNKSSHNTSSHLYPNPFLDVCWEKNGCNSSESDYNASFNTSKDGGTKNKLKLLIKYTSVKSQLKTRK